MKTVKVVAYVDSNYWARSKTRTMAMSHFCMYAAKRKTIEGDIGLRGSATKVEISIREVTDDKKFI